MIQFLYHKINFVSSTLYVLLFSCLSYSLNDTVNVENVMTLSNFSAPDTGVC